MSLVTETLDVMVTVPVLLSWRRFLDAREGISDVAKQVLAPAQVAALVAQRNAHLRQRVLRLAGPLRRLRCPACEALHGHIERLLLDPGRLGGEAAALQSLDTDPDRVGGLADGIGGRDRAIDQGSETADRRDPDQRATESGMPARSSSAWRPSPFSPPEARSPALSMRFRLCSPLWPTETSSALTLSIPTEMSSEVPK